MEEMYNVRFVRTTMRADLRKIRSDLVEIAENEATKLYRLARKMQKMNCSAANIEKCREEARFLHMCAYPERLLCSDIVWSYAFKY